MLYIIYIEYIVDSYSLKYPLLINSIQIIDLQILRDHGKLLTAGYIPVIDSNDPGLAGFHGLTIISEFDSLEQAQIWVRKNINFDKNQHIFIKIKPYKKIF